MARSRHRSMDPKVLSADVDAIVELAGTDPEAASRRARDLAFDVAQATAPPKVVATIERLRRDVPHRVRA